MILIAALVLLLAPTTHAQFNNTPLVSTSQGGIISATYGYFTYISATTLVGDGSGLAGIAGRSSSGDRISTTNVASGGTLGMVVADKGTISFTLAGTQGAAYLHGTLGLVAPGVSTTGTISGTTGYFSGNVGIGAAPGGWKLNVYGGSTALNSQANSGATARNFGPYIYTDRNFGMELGQNGSVWTTRILTRDSDGGIELGKYPTASTTNVNQFKPWMTLVNSGNVGVGTITPTSKFEVSGTIRSMTSSAANPEVQLVNSADGGWTMFSSSNYLYWGRVTNVGAWQANHMTLGPSGSLTLSPATNATNGMQVNLDPTSNGESHIALASASGGNIVMARLAVSSTAGSFNPMVKAGDTRLTFASNGANSGGGLFIGPWSTSNKGMRIDGTNGRVGINVSSPVTQLEVSGTISATAFVGDGSGLTGITGDNLGNHTATQDLSMGANQLTFSNAAADKLYLYSNTYGLGVESSTFTNWSGSQFRWRIGGTSASTGTQYMLLTNAGLTVTGAVDASTQFLGQANDTASAPSFSWTGDTNAGMFRPLADGIGFATGGAERLRITSAISTTAGTLYMTQASTGTSNIEMGSGRSGNGYSYIDLVGDATYTDYGLRLIRGNAGANTNSQLLHRGTGSLDIWAADSGGYVRIGASGVEAMRIASNGNVGIGITNPGAALEISPTAGSPWGLQVDYGNLYSRLSGNQLAAFNGPLYLQSGSTSNTIINPNGGSVGIGTTSPQGNLHIYTAGSAILRLEGGGGYFNMHVDNSSNLFRVYQGSTERWRIDSSGNTMITGASVVCTIGSGSGSTNCTSDARLKTDVREIVNPLDKLALIKGVTFHWRDKNKPQDEQIGVIAQDVEKAFPQVVREAAGYKTVDYAALVAPLIEAVKELKRENDALRSRNDMIEQRLDEQFRGIKADNDNLRADFEAYRRAHP